MELSEILRSDIHRKILVFFHENPASIDTPRGVATWTNQDIKKVSRALKRLADCGLLVAHKVSSTTGYSYTRDKRMMKKIDKLLGK
jgi:predicted transcriptional regulator